MTDMEFMGKCMAIANEVEIKSHHNVKCSINHPIYAVIFICYELKIGVTISFIDIEYKTIDELIDIIMRTFIGEFYQDPEYLTPDENQQAFLDAAEDYRLCC